MPTCITVRRNFVVPSLLEITDPDFAHQYSMGVWWAMYGDYQGNGPYDDRYLIESVSRNIQARRYDNLSSPWFTSLGFYLGMLHGGWLVLPSDTLVVLTDPDFTKGYQQGRREDQQLTDSTLTSMIHQWALAHLTGQALAHELGMLAGHLSYALIPATLLTA
jgi:hypothetical protein